MVGKKKWQLGNLRSHPDQLKSVAGNSRRGPTKHGDYKVYYGELHVHTAYSDGSGSFDELYNLYKNIYKVDFLAITEHDALKFGQQPFLTRRMGLSESVE